MRLLKNKLDDNIIIKEGTTKIMKAVNLWDDYLGDSIDNRKAKIVAYEVVDCECAYWIVDIPGIDDVVGIPDFIQHDVFTSTSQL